MHSKFSFFSLVIAKIKFTTKPAWLKKGHERIFDEQTCKCFVFAAKRPWLPAVIHSFLCHIATRYVETWIQWIVQLMLLSLVNDKNWQLKVYMLCLSKLTLLFDWPFSYKRCWKVFCYWWQLNSSSPLGHFTFSQTS